MRTVDPMLSKLVGAYVEDTISIEKRVLKEEQTNKTSIGLQIKKCHSFIFAGTTVQKINTDYLLRLSA